MSNILYWKPVGIVLLFPHDLGYISRNLNTMKTANISKNIGILMKRFGIKSVVKLAKLLKMSTPTLNKLASGLTPDPRMSTVIPVARYFKISLDALLSNDLEYELLKKPQHTFIPLISYHELAHVHEQINALTIRTWQNWHPIPRQKEDDALYYAVQVAQNQILPPFNNASVLIVEHHLQLISNTYALIKHYNVDNLMIKKIVFEDDKQWLLPLQSELPTAEFNPKKYQILGTIKAFLTDVSNGDYFFT